MTDNYQTIKQPDINDKKFLQQNNHRSTHQKTDSKIEAVVNIKREPFDNAMLTIALKPPESGGLLLGPVGTNDVTDFFFDAGGNVTGASYSPDHRTLNRKMKEEWIPAGIDMKGFIHSHPGRLDTLTDQDLMYIKRLLAANPDMSMFIAPIIIPFEFRMRMMVVFSDNPGTIVEARINFF